MFGKVSGTRLDKLRRCEVLRNADRKLHVSFVQRVITVTGILIALAVPAAGQVLTSRVDGTVQDQSGAVIPGASVTLTNVDTNISLEAETNEVGLYVFPQAPAGPYTITTKLSGFKSTALEGIQIEVDTPATIDIVLEVGVVDETVVVTASQPAMNTVNAEINTNLNREQVKELPLNGRSVTQLALTQAGVTSRGGHPFGFHQWNPRHLQQLHARRHQQPGHVHSNGCSFRGHSSAGKLHRGDQHHDRQLGGRCRAGCIADPVRHPFRKQHVSRGSLLLQPKRRSQREHLLQQRRRDQEREGPDPPVRLQRGRPRREGQALFLLQL